MHPCVYALFVGRAIKQFGNIDSGDGLAEEVALSFRKSVGLEVCQLLRVFDALRCRRQAETLCKAKDRAN